MNGPLTDTVSLSNKTLQYTLTCWIEAISDFHQSYNQLVKYNVPHLSSQNSQAHTGQCSTKQVVTLLRIMRKELATLSREADQLKQPQKINAHTLRLNKLNHQAHTVLYLITQSGS